MEAGSGLLFAGFGGLAMSILGYPSGISGSPNQKGRGPFHSFSIQFEVGIVQPLE